MKIKNLYEINSIDSSSLRTHKFYLTDEAIAECKGSNGDYYYLYEFEVQVECRLRDLGLIGEEKESARIKLLREYTRDGNKYDVESIISTYLDSDMRTEVGWDE